MNQAKLNIIICLAIILTNSCTNDSIEPNCVKLVPPTGVSHEFFYQNKYPIYYFPCFNPTKSNEVSFLKADGLDTTKLFRLDLLTNEKTEIFEGLIYSIPKWSKKDWIIFSMDDNNVYKIKSNGEELTQLTFTGNCFGPEWNDDGDKFIYFQAFTDPNEGVICNEFGTPLDTLFGGAFHFSNTAWRNDLIAKNNGRSDVSIINSNTGEIQIVHEIVDDPGNGGLSEWLDDETILWSYQKGIFKTHIHTKHTTILKESCDSKLYLSPTYSPLTDQVIFQRLDKFQRGENEGKQTSKLFLFDAEFNSEEEILIPD